VDGGAGCWCCFVVSSVVAEVESFGWLLAGTLFSSSLLLSVLMLLSYL
jgi:hypothetical protein